ncbi:MAG TPA: NAD-dependent epimerase/dehydratase family protein [Nitrososphaera sp.]|jgi:GDP-L-fucose synthase
MSFWEGKRVLVTGGTGFIGSHLVELLLDNRVNVRIAARLQGRNLSWFQTSQDRLEWLQGDLLDPDFCEQCCQDMDVVMHAAGKVAGLPYNLTHPAEMLTTNLRIDTNVIDGARKAGVKRYLYISGVTVYPPSAPVPTPEDQGLVGLPDASVSGASWAKRLGEVQAQLYAAQYGMEVAIVRLSNVYGPRDDFSEATSHVIASIIRSVLAHQPPKVWGNGKQSRSYLYVADAVCGLMLATEKYPKAEPINIGADAEITITELVYTIRKLTNSTVPIAFDDSRPVGHVRRLADSRKAQSLLGFQPSVGLLEGLEKTIAWYRTTMTRTQT